MADANGNVRPLLYFYAAMGLRQQHPAQQVLLGHIGLPVMAACFLKAFLDSTRQSTYSLQLPRHDDEGRAGMESDWLSFSRTLALPEPARCALEQIPHHVVAHADESGCLVIFYDHLV